jgi:hypothetical protein
MNILNEVTKKINELLQDEVLDGLAKAIGFMSRKRKIKAKSFLENNMLLALSGGDNSLEALSYEFSEVDCKVSKQALHKKINHKAVIFFQKVLEQLLQQSNIRSGVNLEKFSFLTGIQVVDSSEIKLHKRLQKIFPQVRNQGAAVKLQAIIDISRENLLSLEICNSKESDQGYKNHKFYIEAGALLIADLGYFCVDTFREVINKKGFFLSRYFKKTNLYLVEDKRIDLRSILSQAQENTVELSVCLGETKLPCRCVAVRLTECAYQKRLQHIRRENRKHSKSKRQVDVLDQWTIFVTNLPDSLAGTDLLQFYSLRWQIELLFKMMKTFLRLREVEHRNQYSTQISIYSSLIAMVLLCMTSMSIVDKEISLYKAGKVFVRNIREFIGRMRKSKQSAIKWLRGILCRFALKESRPNRPSTKLKLLQLGAVYA